MWYILLVVITLTTFQILHWFWSCFWCLRDVPGPQNTSFIFGHALQLAQSKIGASYNRWSCSYGQTFKLRGPFLEPWLILGDPKGISHVLLSKAYVRPQWDRVIMELFFGRGLFCAEGEEHRKMRKTLNGAFTQQSVHDVAQVFYDLAYRLTKKWTDHIGASNTKTFNIALDLHILTLDAISMTMFMHNLSEAQDNIPALLHNITNSPMANRRSVLVETLVSIFPGLLRLPSPIKRWADQLRGELGSIAENVWLGKVGIGMHAKLLDSLSHYQNLEHEEITKEEAIAQVFTDQDIRLARAFNPEQIIGILFAGSETTANMIAECIYELAAHPHIQMKLRQELAAFKAATGRDPGIEDILNGSVLPYFDAVSRETFRTKSVLRQVSRAAAEDDIIPLEFPLSGTNQKEVHVKAGQLIHIPIRDGINTDEAIWGSNANDFCPERWIEKGGLPPTVNQIRAQGHVLTFGDGPKVCLGRSFGANIYSRCRIGAKPFRLPAMTEFKIVMCILISHFTFAREDSVLDFYQVGGNTLKPFIRGRESEGVQMPLQVGLA
ncbi:hypothetical protein AMATHDRAFT_42724 [Amanita thiersii Skay4041]|uniref:Cytochrome P450 n=1 Tax=Amanita thiersii Skay4041 TaxID=703135 RepID=A0A2A9NJ06_9AGAR|nr:hypothetical protein AMATHDRAFT_42724 [Amanita thiersii Skay4041]